MNYQNGYHPPGFATPQNVNGAPPGFDGPPRLSVQQQMLQQQLQQQQQQQQAQAQQQLFRQHQFAQAQAQAQAQAHAHAQAQQQFGPMAGANLGVGPGPAGPAGPGGPMMHAAMQQQGPPQQQQPAPLPQAPPQQVPMGGHQGPYPTAPFAPPGMPNSATSMPPQAPMHRTSLSPAKQESPQTPQPRPAARQMSGPQVPPAAPISPPGKAPANARGAVQAPLSPSAKAREKERISLLLHINGELLKEVVKLQGEGKAGVTAATPNTSAGQTSPTQENGEIKKEAHDGEASKEKKAVHPEFVECMRRLQANLAYLASIADRAHKPASQILASPAIMTAPQKVPGMVEPYRKLTVLFATNPAAKTNSATSATSGPPAIPPTSGAINQDPAWSQTPPSEKNYKQWLEEMGKPPNEHMTPQSVPLTQMQAQQMQAARQNAVYHSVNRTE